MSCIIQLSDIHLPKHESYYRGVPVRDNFISILERIACLEPDLLVISGDICAEEGEEETYQWLYEQLESTAMFYEVIAGNHDNSDMIASIFRREKDLKDGELYFSDFLNGRKLIFLDTRKAMCYDAQLEWLASELSNSEMDPFVFMHHPPIHAGVAHMDRNYPFEQSERIMNIFRQSGRNLSIYCGHYHIERSVYLENIAIHITPATSFNLDPYAWDMVIEHTIPGFRIILDEQENGIKQDVCYIFPTPGG